MTPLASRASSLVDVSSDPRSAAGSTAASFAMFAVRVIVVHTVTYTMAGLLASTLLDYRTWWASEFMSQYRPFESAWIAAGPALQVLRGIVFAVVLFPFRHVFLERRRGWMPLAALLIGLGIVSTYAAAPGSIEGLIYTRLPLAYHTFGLPEVVTQATVFSALLVAWYRHPHRAWAVVLGFLMALSVAASAAGVFLGPQ